MTTASSTAGPTERFRLWLTMKLLGGAWLVLPRKHPAYIGIFDAACAIKDPGLTLNLQRDERASFERYAEAEGFCIDRDDSDKYREYHRPTTRWAWRAWLARAALSKAGAVS